MKLIHKIKTERFTIFRPIYSMQQHMRLETMWSPTYSTVQDEKWIQTATGILMYTSMGQLMKYEPYVSRSKNIKKAK
jgi:hypothetical protein